MTSLACESAGAAIDQIDSTRPAHWGGVLAMSLCVFALVASEFMPVSLLTPMATELKVSEGLAGQGIAISGAWALLTSLFIARLAGAMNRKTLLLALTILMGLSGAIIALAPNYLTYMIGRSLIGVVIGGFWSMSAATAMRLVPAPQVPRALAIFNGGNALATVVAAPLGSYLGAAVGWRGAFFGLVPVALITGIWQWVSLPDMRPDHSAKTSGHVLALLKHRRVTVGMAACGAFFMGQFALFTYIRPFLETVTRVDDASVLSLILLTMGVAGLLGTMAVGMFLRRDLHRTLIAIPLVMAIIAIGLIVLGRQLGWAWPLLAIWGLVSTAAPVGWWNWVAQTLPEDAEAGGGLMVAAVQLFIALGSTIGGLLFDMSGYRATFLAGGLALLIAAFLTYINSREKPMELKRAGSQPSVKGPDEYFTGNVRIDPLNAPPPPARASCASVTFEPGARSNWHTHPLGQTLIITAGCGWTQCEGGPIVEIRAGDVVWCPPGHKHWHGATPTTSMTHIAVQEALDGKNVNWMEPVTDEQYNAGSSRQS